MEVDIEKSPLVLVEFPGYYRSEDRMLESFGGKKTLAATFSDPSLRLEMRLRPEDLFSQSIYGERISGSRRLILRVSTTKDGEIKKCRILGLPCALYEFRSLADFQYLPIGENSAGEIVNVQEKLLNPDDLSQITSLEEFNAIDVPFIANPTAFSRFDKPLNWHFKEELTPSVNSSRVKRVTNTYRKRRMHGTVYLSAGSNRLPSIPVALLNRHILPGKEAILHQRLTELFDERPVFTTNALLANFPRDRFAHRQLRHGLVQRHAFYCLGGPFGRTWVRFGYNPTSNQDARKYQVLDFRCHEVMSSNLVKDTRRRSRPLHPRSSEDLVIPLNHYTFTEDELPAKGQSFYQLLDIRLNRVQQLIETSPLVPYSVKSGWYTSKTLEMMRSIMHVSVRKLLSSAPPKVEEVSNEKEDSSDYETVAEFPD